MFCDDMYTIIVIFFLIQSVALHKNKMGRFVVISQLRLTRTCSLYSVEYVSRPVEYIHTDKPRVPNRNNSLLFSSTVSTGPVKC